MKNNKILLVNPGSANHNHRLPLSILQIAASIEGKHEYAIVDGNLENDTWGVVEGYLSQGNFKYFACTVMPGPQLIAAASLSGRVRSIFPHIIIIWGGYFPSLHPALCIGSGLTDYIIRGSGDTSFPCLIDWLQGSNLLPHQEIANLIYKNNQGEICEAVSEVLSVQDENKGLPYSALERFYPMKRYVVKTFLGTHTLPMHSSMGCPYGCGFCGVAEVYQSRWKGRPAQLMFNEVMELKEKYHINAIEFFDSNFFNSTSRITEFTKLMKGKQIQWWAEGRVDTLNQYSDGELSDLKEAGCRLVFMGAETGSDELLLKMNKGSGMKVADTLNIAGKFRKAGIIPQFSFVFGSPEETRALLRERVRDDIRFIRKLKKINPDTEIVVYFYSPVVSESSGLFRSSENSGLKLPATLDGWLNSDWELFDMRQGRNMPWVDRKTRKLVRNFEVVMIAAYPGITNFHINRLMISLLKIPGRIRYYLKWYRFPAEIKLILKITRFLKQGKEGFYSK